MMGYQYNAVFNKNSIVLRWIFEKKVIARKYSVGFIVYSTKADKVVKGLNVLSLEYKVFSYKNKSPSHLIGSMNF